MISGESVRPAPRAVNDGENLEVAVGDAIRNGRRRFGDCQFAGPREFFRPGQGRRRGHQGKRVKTVMPFERPMISQRDLLLANKWTSLFFTTYSLSLSFLEAAALSAVARSYLDCTILADIEGYRSSLADAGAVEVGRRYDVVPIKVRRGIFHPKVAIMADGEGNVRAGVGSGNLTFGGWGYNSEILVHRSLKPIICARNSFFLTWFVALLLLIRKRGVEVMAGRRRVGLFATVRLADQPTRVACGTADVRSDRLGGRQYYRCNKIVDRDQVVALGGFFALTVAGLFSYLRRAGRSATST